MIFRFLQVEKTIHMKCRNAGDCPIIHIKFPGPPALPPHGMKVMSEARKMMTSSQLCHPCRDGLPGHGPDYKEMFPAGREPYSQRSGILFPRLGNPVPGAWESDSRCLGIRFPAGCVFPYLCGLSDRSGFVLGTVQIYPDSTKTSFYIKNRCALPDCYQTFSHW